MEEVWVIKDGNSWEELSKENIEKNYPELYKLIGDYHTTYTQTGYSTDDAHDKPDEQSISVNNYLSGTKTIKWNKSWHDEYNYSNGTRPDIYLDIYKKEHVRMKTVPSTRKRMYIYQITNGRIRKTVIRPPTAADSTTGRRKYIMFPNTMIWGMR